MFPIRSLCPAGWRAYVVEARFPLTLAKSVCSVSTAQGH